MEPKAVKSVDESCPNCGAGMKYSPQRKMLFCESCETTRAIEFKKLMGKHNLNEATKATKNTIEWASQTKSLKCPNCGAGVVLNKLEYSKKCPYCSSSLVAREAAADDLAPDGIIPFTFSDEEASVKYVQGIKKKFFAPSKFKKAPPTENIKGVYIPCFCYDAKTASLYSGTLAKDYNYTDSSGKRKTRTETKRISGKHDEDIVDVVVETSSKMNQKQINDILPFNMMDVVEFKQAFIMGYTVEHYENTIKVCNEIAKNIMKEQIKNNILSKYDYDRVLSFNLETSYSDEKYAYYLLPTYKCDYVYKNKTYTTFMNGQTGKVGKGFPISPLKVTFVVLLSILLVAGFIALAYFMG